MNLAKIKAMWNDRSGVAATEFAILAPIMVLTFVGVVELSHFLTIDRKVTAAAFNAADLLSRYEEVADSDIQDIFTMAESILVPYDTINLDIRLTSVNIDSDGATEVGWSDANNITPLTAGASFDLPDGLEDFEGSILVAETFYDHETVTIAGALFFGNSMSFSEIAYLKPRLTSLVTRN